MTINLTKPKKKVLVSTNPTNLMGSFRIADLALHILCRTSITDVPGFVGTEKRIKQLEGDLCDY